MGNPNGGSWSARNRTIASLGHGFRGRFWPVVVIAALLIALVPASGSAQTEVTEEDVSAGVHARKKYGLRADRAHVRSLLRSKTDDRSNPWGLPMTKAEADGVDMNARMRFEVRIHDQVIPYVESLSNFGGAYIDQAKGGRLVVLLKGPTDEIKDRVRSRMPRISRGVTFKRADHTRGELEAAFRKSFKVWTDDYPNVPVQGFAVDDQRNAIVIDVAEGAIDRVTARVDDFAKRLGVRVLVAETVVGNDLACNNRSHCRGPLRAGVQIYGGALWNANKRCAMGFHIWVPNSETASSPNRQFLTAGHCTFLSNKWYHWKVGGDGHIGNKKKSQYGNSFARDIARVAISVPSEVSVRIYGEFVPEVVHQPRSPSQGETLCMSLPRFNKNVPAKQQTGQGIITCGTVAATSHTWKSETANPDRIVHGASLDSNKSPKKTAIGGDSGSPVYKLQWEAGGTLNAYPIGILDHERYPKAGQTPCPPKAYGCHDFYFAVIKSAFNHADWNQITIID